MSTTRGAKIRPPSAFGRVEQFITTLTHRHSDEIDLRIRSLLANDEQWQLIERLSAFDRAHLLRVHDRLVAQGYTDPDLLHAALLHDVGKSNGGHHVGVWHRVVRVLGRRFAPRLWSKLADSRWRLTMGLYLAEHHARLGAGKVRATGGSERCVELIARHEERLPTGDPSLDALIIADEEC